MLKIKIRMDETLRFWVECEYDRRKVGIIGQRRDQIIADILLEWEACGEAMRFCDADGVIAWKASPEMLERLANDEAEALADSEHHPDGPEAKMMADG